MVQRTTYLVWTENSPGVLLRLTTLFTKRKINVESLTVSSTETENISRFTVVVIIDSLITDTIREQISRIVEVQRVLSLPESEIIHREVALMRVNFGSSLESSVLSKYTNAKVISDDAKGTLIEICGMESEIDALLKELDGYQLLELVRSGRVAVNHSGEYDLRGIID